MCFLWKQCHSKALFGHETNRISGVMLCIIAWWVRCGSLLGSSLRTACKMSSILFATKVTYTPIDYLSVLSDVVSMICTVVRACRVPKGVSSRAIAISVFVSSLCHPRSKIGKLDKTLNESQKNVVLSRKHVRVALNNAEKGEMSLQCWIVIQWKYSLSGGTHGNPSRNQKNIDSQKPVFFSSNKIWTCELSDESSFQKTVTYVRKRVLSRKAGFCFFLFLSKSKAAYKRCDQE